MRVSRASCPDAQNRATPPARQAIVRPPDASAAHWAMPSIPDAAPEARVCPRSTSPAAISMVVGSPQPVPARAPTIAVVFASVRISLSPRTHSANGACSPTSLKRVGQCGRSGATRVAPGQTPPSSPGMDAWRHSPPARTVARLHAPRRRWSPARSCGGI